MPSATDSWCARARLALRLLPASLTLAPYPTPHPPLRSCLAGLFELLRTRGLWLPSVRYGLLFGAFKPGDSAECVTEKCAAAKSCKIKDPSRLWSESECKRVASIFESE